MQWSDISFTPPARTLRQFAGLWLVFFAGLACWQGLVRGRPALAIALAVLAVAVGLLGLAWPQRVRRVYVGWMVLAFPVGWAVSRLVLAALYYGLFTPVGLVFRLVGRDALRLRRPDPEGESYWIPKRAATVGDYYRQF